jgi:hypothetical protein
LLIVALLARLLEALIVPTVGDGGVTVPDAESLPPPPQDTNKKESNAIESKRNEFDLMPNE